MKLKYTVLPAAVVVLFSAVSMAAPGPTGKVTLRGTINAPTCEVEGTTSATHDVGKYEVKQINALTVGQEIHGATSFDIKLKGCTGEYVDMSMVSDNIDEAGGIKYLKINGGDNAADGVGIVLRTNQFPLNYDPARLLTRKIENGSASYTLTPSLIKTAAVTKPGVIQAEVNYFLSYR